MWGPQTNGISSAVTPDPVVTAVVAKPISVKPRLLVCVMQEAVPWGIYGTADEAKIQFTDNATLKLPGTWPSQTVNGTGSEPAAT